MNPLRQLLAEAWARTLASNPSAVPPAAVDSETFYRTEKTARKQNSSPCTVELSGNWGYCRHPEWGCYLVSIYSPGNPAAGYEEVEYVGPPELAPWEKIAGRVWLSHNRGFDRHVWERLRETHKGVDWSRFSEWHDTADLAVYCHLPRALAKVMLLHFGLELDKGARADMDGKRWADLDKDARERMLDYAIDDALACCLVWLTLESRWPKMEREVSVHTGNIEFRGIPVNVEQIDRDIGILETALWEVRKRIPWVDKDDEDTGKPFALRSKKALDLECLKAGVPPPESTAQKSKEFLEWLDEYGERVPAIIELGRYRRVDRALGVYRALKARIRPDGRAALGLKYMGADKTGRFSGANKFNLQNLMKAPLAFDSDFNWLDFDDASKSYVRGDGVFFRDKEVYLVDVRRTITASPGRKLVMPDLSQIEPRVLNWLVGNTAFLDACRSGLSPYEAHAAASGFRWEGKMKETLPGMYAYYKARLLALGYAAGWHKFIEMARGYCKTEAQFLAIFAKKPDEACVERFISYLEWLVKEMNHSDSKRALAVWPELDEQTQNIWVNSWLAVQDFRATNPQIAGRENERRGTKSGLWEELDKAFKASVKDGVFENELPSGRVLKYFAVSPQWGWSCRPGNPMAKPQRTYGGLLTENMVQAIARDVFVHGVMNLERAGYEVLFHVHDEAIVDAPADADVEEIKRLLCQVPDWCRSLPVASDAAVGSYYRK
jgi:hypothetical protein